MNLLPSLEDQGISHDERSDAVELAHSGPYSRWNPFIRENECRSCGQPCGPFLVCFGCGPEEYGYER